ncbi:MAG: PEP-CTERM sorting domain-containing protein [Akkermansiaceae bacterium]
MKYPIIHTLTLCSLAASAQAASIGINFGAGRAESALGAADSAGVIAQANWNNASGDSGSLAVLNTDDGNASGASVSWATDEQWSAGTGVTNPDATLLNGWISANSTAAPDATIDITNIPFAVYNLYVYMNHDRTTEDVDLTGPFGTFRLHETDSDLEVDITGAVTWVQQTADANGDSTQEGNYALFTGLTDSDLNLILGPAGAEGSADRGAITGIQLVAVPEPSTSILALLAGLGFVGRRRR